MTGLAPISNAAAVGANSAVATNSGAQSASSQRPSDFSSVLNATANAPQTATAAAGSKSVVAAQLGPSRTQKAPTSQTNPQASVVQVRVNVPAATPVLLSSLLAATAAAPVPPPVPPATAESLNLLQAGSQSPATENAALAAQAVAASSVTALPVNPADTAESKIASAASPATTNGANDSVPAQTGSSQSTTGAEQSAALAAGAEVAATISSAVGLAAAANPSQVGSSPVDPSQADSAKASSAQNDAATSSAPPATMSTAKPAATPELAPKLALPQTVLPAQIPAAAKANPIQTAPPAVTAPAPSVRGGQNSRPISQAAAPETTASNSTTANASLQKAISDARDKLVQAIDASLQAEISAAPTKAVSSVNPANGGSGNPAGQNPANPSFNSSAQDLLKQYSDTATGAATSASGNSSNPDALGANNPPSTAEKAATLIAAATDPALHVLPDASQQASSATTTATPPQTASTMSASAARPAPPPPSPLPQPLPQSLGDVAKASEMYQRVGGSEMHVAMETDLLGAVDLRATMHQSTLTATIGVQRADIQALLSNELPALQHALADRNLHVDQISVLNNSVGGRAGSSEQQEAPAQHSSTPRGGYPSNVMGTATGHAEDVRMSTGASSMAHLRSDDGGRISVHV
jgi:hypothetical protein